MMVFSELLIGVALGVATNIVFDGVQMAGQVLSVQMGYSLVNILDPQTQVESTVVATFHQTIAMLIFLASQCSYLDFARTGAQLRLFAAFLGPFRGRVYVCGVGGRRERIFASGIQIAAPVLSATLLADIALGLLGKASPQLPLMLLGPAVKSILGLLILISALKYWPNMFERLFLNSMDRDRPSSPPSSIALTR